MIIKFWAFFSGVKKNLTRYILISGVVFSFYLILFACAKDPDALGKDLLPSSDNINVKVDSSSKVSSYSISGKRLLTSSNDYYALGSRKDSIFGYSNASILTQFHPSYLTTDSIEKIDSLVLYLAPNDTIESYFYGDSASQMTLRIFELNQKLLIDSVYYSDLDPSEYYDNAVELATCTFSSYDTLIRVRITDPDFLIKFAHAPDSTFFLQSKFFETFFGLYLKVDQVSDKGGYTYIDFSNTSSSRLTLFYNGNDTASFGLEMGFKHAFAAHVNVFTHDYTGFPVATNLNLPEQDTVMFIEGLAGTSGRISFPELDKWRSMGRIAINKAELILPVEKIANPYILEENYPEKLLLVSLQAGDTYQNLYDDLIDNTSSNIYFNGSYEPLLDAYVFSIGLQLQSFINGDIDNTDLILLSRKSNSTANRVILKGGNALSSPIKLKVIYTELL